MTVQVNLFIFLSLLCTLLSYAFADNSFENTAVVRVIELQGSLVHSKTTFMAKSLDTGAMVYTFALGKEEGEKTSFIEARIKNEERPLELQHFGFNAQTCVTAANSPRSLLMNILAR